MKILLAEDDMNISAIAKMVLEQIGQHEVTAVHDGESAVSAALSESFDLILLDEMMPKLNGLKALEKIQQQLSHPPPVIFLSAKSQTEEIDKLRSKALGFIAKPFDPNSLCQTIDDLLKEEAS